jgi:hypothetical protein
MYNTYQIHNYKHKLSTLLCHTCIRACKVAASFVHGARALEHAEFESKHENILIKDDDSLYNAAYVIATTFSYPAKNMIDDQKEYFNSVEYLDRDSNRDSIGGSRHSESMGRDSTSSSTHGLNVALLTPKDPLSYPLSKVDFKQLQISCIRFCNLLDPSQHHPHVDGEKEKKEEEEEEDDDDDDDEEELIDGDAIQLIELNKDAKKKEKNTKKEKKSKSSHIEEKEEHLEEELLDEEYLENEDGEAENDKDKEDKKKKKKGGGGGFLAAFERKKVEKIETESPSEVLKFFCLSLVSKKSVCVWRGVQ